MPLGSTTRSQPGVPEDRILVVVQPAGGNDGLNTVVPYGDANYHMRGRSRGFPSRGAGNNARCGRTWTASASIRGSHRSRN
ncbi:MAG: hypothetical protein U0575_01565 [Phycisphaerales bacterium]